jgi:eukaryotic-like serine/threonine-protein kinase
VIGTLLNGRFRLEEQIGSGGMSTVYRAFDETLERWVAIKIMHREISSDAAQLERFRREARAVARLSHEHVVTVIDAGEDEGHPYIVFEYVEGETLKDRIRRLGRLPVDQAVAYAIEIGRALMAAHAERLVHRDVKPQNVLIDLEGRAKVTDFGIARSLEAEGLTVTGRVLGTTDYVSPEQALGETVTEQSDVYSLGICLYEMLVGDVPFRADTQVGVAMKHVRDPLPDVRRRRPEVSAALAAVIERATAKETKNRYATAEEMVADLEEALAIEVARTGQTTGEATTVLRALPKKRLRVVPLRLRNPRGALLSTLLLAAVAAVVIVVLATRTEQGTTGGAAREGAGKLRSVTLSTGGIHDFDPPPGDGRESSGSVRNAIDGNPSTLWGTEHYRDGFAGVDKPGVGIYVEARSAVAARALKVITPKPGWDAEVYAANDVPSTLSDWGPKLGEASDVGETAQIQIDTAGQRFRRYLLWIVTLPDNEQQAQVSELTLLR